MSEPVWIYIYRTAFGLVAIWAVIAKYVKDDDSFWNWISKFTVEANSYAGMILLGGAWLAYSLVTSRRWDGLRGAAVVYLVITFFVYGFLIREFDNPFNTTRHWTHTVLHQLMPVVVVLDLVLQPFRNRLEWRSAIRWSIYPLLFLAYSLLRGEITDWYPYDFIDHREVGGYDGVALYCAGILAGFMAVSSLVIGTSRLTLNGHWHLPRGMPA